MSQQKVRYPGSQPILLVMGLFSGLHISNAKPFFPKSVLKQKFTRSLTRFELQITDNTAKILVS